MGRSSLSLRKAKKPEFQLCFDFWEESGWKNWGKSSDSLFLPQNGNHEDRHKAKGGAITGRTVFPAAFYDRFRNQVERHGSSRSKGPSIWGRRKVCSDPFSKVSATHRYAAAKVFRGWGVKPLCDHRLEEGPGGALFSNSTIRRFASTILRNSFGDIADTQNIMRPGRE